MVVQYPGTPAQRLAHMDKIGRRCDGNSRHCVNAAVDVYTLIRVNGNGVPETKKACGRHRIQFLRSPDVWTVVTVEKYALSKQPKAA